MLIRSFACASALTIGTASSALCAASTEQLHVGLTIVAVCSVTAPSVLRRGAKISEVMTVRCDNGFQPRVALSSADAEKNGAPQERSINVSDLTIADITY